MDFDLRRFPPNEEILLACHITGVHDVNRQMTLENDSYDLVREWAESVAAAQLKGVIFHNNFTKETCDKFEIDFISFVEVTYEPRFNPNVFRYFVYKDFLERYADHFKGIFITDVNDVVLVQNPFIHPYFLEHPSSLFCGDEPKNLNDEWMQAHSTHLRNNIADYSEYEEKFKDETLLNCGIIGGSAPLMIDFIQQLCSIHELANQHNLTAFTGDMGAFNYLVRTRFNTHVLHGAPVNTVFKCYENDRTDCWFRHK
jgi:hypothetical protein